MRLLAGSAIAGIILGGAVTFGVVADDLASRPTKADVQANRALIREANRRADIAAWNAAVAEKRAAEARYIAMLLAAQIRAGGGTPVASVPAPTPVVTPTTSPCVTVNVRGKCIDPPGLGG